MNPHPCTGLALASMFLSHASACLWDRDTLAMERARFPGMDELITGRFARHSQEFYQWRKEQTEKAIAADPDQIELYDDLAVAKHKLGDHQGAIETMIAKEKRDPGQYETASNLGTFFIYANDLANARKWIDRALAINPNAHFGREKYQRWLIDWIEEGFRGGSVRRIEGFAGFLLEMMHAIQRWAGNPDGQNRVRQKFEVLRWNEALAAKDLERELKAGAAFAAKVREEEIAWIRAGKDAGAEFEKKYLKARATAAPVAAKKH